MAPDKFELSMQLLLDRGRTLVLPGTWYHLRFMVPEQVYRHLLYTYYICPAFMYSIGRNVVRVACSWLNQQETDLLTRQETK